MLPAVHYHAVRDPDRPKLFINVHSHGYKQMGFPEFCYIADDNSITNENDTNEIFNAMHTLYEEVYDYGIPLNISVVHVFDDSQMSDKKPLILAFIPVTCYDEECLMVIRVTDDNNGEILHEYQMYKNSDRWQGIEMNGKWLFDKKYKTIVFNEYLMKARIINFMGG